jgi:hypothetical protein
MDTERLEWSFAKASESLRKAAEYGVPFDSALDIIVIGEIRTILDDIVEDVMEYVGNEGYVTYMEDVDYRFPLRLVVLRELRDYADTLYKEGERTVVERYGWIDKLERAKGE